MPRRALLRVLVCLLAVLAVALTGQTAVQTALQTASASAPTTFTVRPGANQLEVLDATPGTEFQLLHQGAVVESGTADSLGSLLWRRLPSGVYEVRPTADPSSTSGPEQVTRFGSPPPPESFYRSQTLTPGWTGDAKGASSGFNFIETRDGTTLSANVRLPGPADQGPYPTVVEYSGYDPSNPAETSLPQLFNLLGFAYVGVNIRGTGCSGGSFRPFEPVQSLDGYDAIETIAAQPWVKFHKVGMVGISYPGIEQLYVARTDPPHLSAITPLSVLDDSYRGTLWPGGILNTGFAESWASARAHDARPYGEGWEQGMVDQGFTQCATNQDVRLQNPDPVALIEGHQFFDLANYAKMDPTRFVHDINVPVYLAGAWQDEETGGKFPDFLDRFTSSPHFYATISNGSHTESLDSLSAFTRYTAFLDLYVAREVPNNAGSFVGPILANQITGISGMTMPPSFDYSGMTYAEAKQHFEAQKPIRIQFEEGDAAGEPSGAPVARFSHSFSSWPIPSAQVTRYFLRPHGGLRAHPVKDGIRTARPRSFSADPSALPATDYTGTASGIWAAHPAYDWRQIPRGTGLGWITQPFKKTQVVIGSGSLDVWVKSSTPDVDLEATVSDVRPNGTEVYVQSGWLRASQRALNWKRTTPTMPVHLDFRSDVRPMPTGQFRKLRLEIMPFAQPFRAGDRLRVTLDAPGGAKPLWAFKTIDDGQKVTIATDRRHQSSLALSVVPGVAVPKGRPVCGSLRSQPCRTYPG
jgi:uncharacterized protein